MTSSLDAASDFAGFDWDATWGDDINPYFRPHPDFYVTSISTVQRTPPGQDPALLWDYLRDLFISGGGSCGNQNSPGQVLWAYGVYYYAGGLGLSSEFAVVHPGDTITLAVLDKNDLTDFNAGYGPIQGATIGGATSDASGSVTFTAPLTPGCYKYKAIKDNYIRSPPLFLTVATDLPV